MTEPAIKIYQRKLCLRAEQERSTGCAQNFSSPTPFFLSSTTPQNRSLNSSSAPFITCISNIPRDTLITMLCFNCYSHLDYMVILQPEVNIKLLPCPAEEPCAWRENRAEMWLKVLCPNYSGMLWKACNITPYIAVTPQAALEEHCRVYWARYRGA